MPPTPAAATPPELLRFLGSGGFGEVWLVRDTAGTLKALKRIPANARRAIAREEEALLAFQRSIGRITSPNILPIEHVFRTSEALCYLMPLADGTGALSPEDPAWKPRTLEELTRQQRTQPRWFSGAQIRHLLTPVVDAATALSHAGLVHRDIKPSNILFRNGSPCLADFGLLHADSPTLSAIGTPGFFAPSWYLETGGNPDLWGLACVLYTLLSGNSPDKLGRPAYRWPPTGEAALPAHTRAEWLRLHRVVQRATHEQPTERYLRLEDFRAALMATAKPPAPPLRGILAATTLAILVGGACTAYFLRLPGPAPSQNPPSTATQAPSAPTPETPSPAAPAPPRSPENTAPSAEPPGATASTLPNPAPARPSNTALPPPSPTGPPRPEAASPPPNPGSDPIFGSLDTTLLYSERRPGMKEIRLSSLPTHSTPSDAVFTAREKTASIAMHALDVRLTPTGLLQELDPKQWPEVVETGGRIARGEIPRSSINAHIDRVMKPVDEAVEAVRELVAGNYEDIVRYNNLVRWRNSIEGSAWIHFNGFIPNPR